MEVKICTVDQPSETYAKQAKKGNKMRPVANVNKQCCTAQPSAGLGEDIAARLLELAPNAESTRRGDRCLVELQSMMQWLGPKWSVRPFGSYANGFGTVHSDMDVTCCMDGQMLGRDSQQQATSDLQMWILPMLREHASFSIVEEILGARVPILKLRFENELDVDLSCHNPKPLLNTQLLKSYSQMDSRIKDLCIAIKVWAKDTGVCDATKSNLSSYSFTLLVIYFLQVHPDVHLPVLPVEAFEDHGKQEMDELVIAAMTSWQCRLSLPELLLRFYAFYSNRDSNGFAWGSEVVSVRCGGRRMAQDPSFGRLRGTHLWRLHIEDPFQIERNLHCVLGEVEEGQLCTAFSEAWYDMHSNRLPLPLRSRSGLDHPAVKQGGKEVLRGIFSSAVAESQELEGHEHETKQEQELADLIQVYKTTQVMGTVSSVGSTKSGETPQTMSSDDESGTESP